MPTTEAQVRSARSELTSGRIVPELTYQWRTRIATSLGCGRLMVKARRISVSKLRMTCSMVRSASGSDADEVVSGATPSSRAALPTNAA